ncbi:MAG: hypothetical protein HY000_30885 [Planctomycetes bacterium]|nr:hypothetical protein [Planctomycetota bacterium]
MSSGWKPLAGDWNADGVDSVGLVNSAANVFFLRRYNSAGNADMVYQFGPAGVDWLPLTGDWDGDGDDTVGLYNPATSVFYLKNTHAGGPADITFQFGAANSGWSPVIGDWDGDGVDTIGLYAPSAGAFFLRNSNTAGAATIVTQYGPSNVSWQPIAADWNRDRIESVALFDPATSTFFARNDNGPGPAQLMFSYGPPNAGWVPLIGDWDGPTLPSKTGERFTVDDFNNKVTVNDLGFNHFGGNSGTINQPALAPDAAQITTIDLADNSSAGSGASLDIDINFNHVQTPGGEPAGEFGGVFTSLFGLTDTKISLDGSGVEPAMSTPLPGYFLDFDNVLRRFGTLGSRSVDRVEFDVKLASMSAPLTLKIELKDESGFDVFSRVQVSSSGWTTVSLPRTAFSSSQAGHGDTAPFNWRRVSVLALLVERKIFDPATDAQIGTNPVTGRLHIDDLRLTDLDGQYPNLAAIKRADGSINHPYKTAFLAYVRESSSRYFVDFASTDPRTGGIAQDRSTFGDLMTVGGAGFQLTSYVIDTERGYVGRSDSANRILKILRILDQNQGPERVGRTGYQGFFYHFLGIDGNRKQNFDFAATTVNEALNTVELSVIDTALAVAGVVTAGQYFQGNTATEAEIRLLADRIYGRVNWRFMLAEVPDRQNPTQTLQQFYLGWKPSEVRDDDSGMFGRFNLNDGDGLGQFSSKLVDGDEVPATLDFYTDEGLLVALLAMGSPNPSYRVDRSVWDDLMRDFGGGSFVKTYPGALFTYQFFSAWLDTELLGRDNHPVPVDFFENTQRAIEATRAYASANPLNRDAWQNGGGETRWGLSAAEGPFDVYFAEAAPPAALSEGEPSSRIVHEAEGATASGDGQLQQRSNASGQQTIQLDAGEVRNFAFETVATGYVAVKLRYSNDNFNNLPNETLHVRIDGVLLDSPVTASDTGDGGLGWNVFAETGNLGHMLVQPGMHQVSVLVSGGDGGGIELDSITIQCDRPLEAGTVTVYGAGSSVVHAPVETIDALWESQMLGLLHPRFGFADAFNLDVADALPPCKDPDDDPRILRDSGPWANFNGFAIDHGPMAILIDSYLEDQFVPKLFMSHPQIRAALDMLFDEFGACSPM